MDEKQTENYDSLQYARYYDSLIHIKDYDYKLAIPNGGRGIHNPKMNTEIRFEPSYGGALAILGLIINVILIIYFAVKIVKNICKFKNNLNND